jgi:hypothetical protein
MKREKTTTTSAKILYRPVGLVTSIMAGLLASMLFRWAWKRVAHRDDPPTALESEYPLKEILVAAVFQGAIYAVVRALADRGGARAYERVTGDWPGN